ncbi:immune inhibitor A domain-containing protein [Abyssisolibacter fermentans]|uniref:immune inhibitor A domain-containing protein n=1 Tax=Abyssisolibacter fermentans TaxID=1766203 RepID=UPI000836D778|nr:immune inhibitor A domain-containing protein [Abyssisolibacter fermentans]
MKKVLSVFLSLVLVFGMLSIMGMSNVQATKDEWDTERYGDVLDIGTYLRHLENDEDYRDELDNVIKEMAENLNLNEESNMEADNNDDNFTFNGGTKYYLGYDSLNGYYIKTYTLRSLGDTVEVWVADDLSFEDGRPTHVVTQEQVDKLRDEFDNNIYQKDTEFFGVPDSHIGENAQLPGMVGLPQDYYTPNDGIERVIMLVDNIRDENFYDSEYPFFVAGFYSSTYESYFDRNIISIDTNDWEERLETTFCGTVAHEFQHLIHDDNDSAEETWINEGMSEFAEYLCGYGHPMGHVNFFLDHPENSLVEWDDHYSATSGPETLADYGQAYLLQLYFNDKYGKDFVKALATDGEDQGIESVNKILAEFGTGIDFEELFRRFTIAVAIDSNKPGNGIYEFDNIDVSVNYESALEYDKDGVPAWGGDYKAIDISDKIRTIIFDGTDFMPIPWEVVEDPLGVQDQVIWGNFGDEADNKIIIEADLTSVESATLKFDNYYEIEEQWDFGMVQVSTDDGETWVSLGNENTRNDVVEEGYPKIKENLPGFTGVNYEEEPVWTEEIFDLSEYAGEKIYISFRYLTDWGTNEAGWFIDNIEIPEIDYENTCDSIEAFVNINEIKENYVEYAVSFINKRTVGKNGKNTLYKVVNVEPFNINEEDALELRQLFKDGENYMIIWYAAPSGEKGSAEFTYEIITKENHKKNGHGNN